MTFSLSNLFNAAGAATLSGFAVADIAAGRPEMAAIEFATAALAVVAAGFVRRPS
jgi:hypothetical protein